MRFIPAVSLVQIQLQPPYGPMVKRLRHRPFTAVTRVRFPFGSPGRIAQLVRAPASHAGGQRFESVCAHQKKPPQPGWSFFACALRTRTSDVSQCFGLPKPGARLCARAKLDGVRQSRTPRVTFAGLRLRRSSCNFANADTFACVFAFGKNPEICPRNLFWQPHPCGGVAFFVCASYSNLRCLQNASH